MAFSSIMATGAGVSAAGAYYEAKGQQSALRYSAAAAELNSKVSQQNALSADTRGEYGITQQQLQTAQVKGRQKVNIAASGIDMTEGSALALLTGTDVMGQIDVNTLKANATAEAFGLRSQATQYAGEAAVNRATASAISPGAAAATSLIGSAATVAGKWMEASTVGALKGKGLSAMRRNPQLGKDWASVSAMRVG